ncbi:MAG: MBL fold metallo-hydrolase [DPANN group archaeon]|nr:MBL fold metallo-hydrolase [DPANN group archaeon]
MQVYQLKIGPMDNFCYVLACEASKEAILIDPGWEKGKVQDFLTEKELTPVLIISTHSHYDHVQENDAWKQEGIKILAHELAVDAKPDIKVKDKETYDFCNETITFLHAPGHDLGGMLIKAGKNLFTGDVLFIGAIGRTDLPGSDPAKMQETLSIIKNLAENLIVWPGHDYGPVAHRLLGIEKRENPFLRSALHSGRDGN